MELKHCNKLFFINGTIPNYMKLIKQNVEQITIQYITFRNYLGT